jgi:hypothetical protein
MRIVLDQDDFDKLSRGEVIKKESVEIALSDIGYYKMIDILENNLVGSDEQLEFRKKHQILDPDNAAFLQKLRADLLRLKKK